MKSTIITIIVGLVVAAMAITYNLVNAPIVIDTGSGHVRVKQVVAKMEYATAYGEIDGKMEFLSKGPANMVGQTLEDIWIDSGVITQVIARDAVFKFERRVVFTVIDIGGTPSNVTAMRPTQRLVCKAGMPIKSCVDSVKGMLSN